MSPFGEFPVALARQIRFVLSDVDDTLTEGPRLPAATYNAIERLQRAGLTVIPVTAAPAGWCDLMARMWPIAAVIGENGGLCFRRDPQSGTTERYYWATEEERLTAQARLARHAGEIAAAVPGSQIAHDQRYRETTLAFANSRPAVSAAILGHLAAAGACTAVNSLWVLGWFGGFDKLTMTRRMMKQLCATDIDRDPGACLYVGDSPNDAPMFAFFPHSVGVASVGQYADHLPTPPCWITEGGGGAGFIEVAELLLASQRG